jgi:hypothetical protein
MESEILNPGSVEQVIKTSFHALPSAHRPWLRRKNPVFTNYGGKTPQLAGEFGKHRHVTHFQPFSFALTANSPSPYITSDHLRPKYLRRRIAPQTDCGGVQSLEQPSVTFAAVVQQSTALLNMS